MSDLETLEAVARSLGDEETLRRLDDLWKQIDEQLAGRYKELRRREQETRE